MKEKEELFELYTQAYSIIKKEGHQDFKKIVCNKITKLLQAVDLLRDILDQDNQLTLSNENAIGWIENHNNYEPYHQLVECYKEYLGIK